MKYQEISIIDFNRIRANIFSKYGFFSVEISHTVPTFKYNTLINNKHV